MPRNPISFQEIMRKRQQKEFVGRAGQIALFENNLRLSLEDERRKFIFNIFGQGGVGKTSLADRFRKLVNNVRGVTAWLDDGQDDLPTVLGRIAELFAQQGHPLKKFSERYRVYRQRRQELEADPDIPQGLSSLVGRSLAKTGLNLARITPLGGVISEFVNEDALVAQVGEWSNYVARKLTNKDEVHLVQEPIEVLTPLLVEGLGEISEEILIAFFFDTYERTQDVLDSWLRDLLKGRYGDLPANILFVISGQQELDKNRWADYTGLVEKISLEPFTEDEAREYLNHNEISDERIIEVILTLSGRLPLLVATLAAESPKDPQQVGSPGGTAIERFLKWVDEPKQRQLALDAALPRSLNLDIFSVIAPDQPNSLFTWLRGMPFVQERPTGWVYHGVVRSHMLRHKLQESPQSWSELHGRLAEHFESLRDALGLEVNKALLDEKWQALSLEALFHRLCQDPFKHLTRALNGFVEAYDKKKGFAYRWADTIREAGLISGVSELIEWGTQLLEASKPAKEMNPAKIIESLTKLLKSERIENQNRHIILGRRGLYHALLIHETEAGLDFEHALELNPTSSRVLSDRGFIKAMAGNIEEALADFERSLAIEPNEGAYTGLAFTNALRGRPEEATHWLDQAIEADSSLSEIRPGLMLFINMSSTLSAMHHLFSDSVDTPDSHSQLSGSSELSLEGDSAGHLTNPLLPTPVTPPTPMAWEKPDNLPTWGKDVSPEMLQVMSAFMLKYMPRLLSLLTGNDSALFSKALDVADVTLGFQRFLEMSAEDPASLEIVLTSPHHLVETANAFIKGGEYDKALLVYDEAININPKLATILSNSKGLVLTYLGRYAEAVECYKSDLSNSPDNFVTLYNLAIAEGRQNGVINSRAVIDEARTALTSKLNTSERGSALYGLGGLEALMGNKRQALDYLEEAIAHNIMALDWARNDVAWLDLREEERFKAFFSPSNE